ncbi:MAG: DUF6483 family protein, partial [Bacilli bacterium]
YYISSEILDSEIQKNLYIDENVDELRLEICNCLDESINSTYNEYNITLAILEQINQYKKLKDWKSLFNLLSNFKKLEYLIDIDWSYIRSAWIILFMYSDYRLDDVYGRLFNVVNNGEELTATQEQRYLEKQRNKIIEEFKLSKFDELLKKIEYLYIDLECKKYINKHFVNIKPEGSFVVVTGETTYYAKAESKLSFLFNNINAKTVDEQIEFLKSFINNKQNGYEAALAYKTLAFYYSEEKNFYMAEQNIKPMIKSAFKTGDFDLIMSMLNSKALFEIKKRNYKNAISELIYLSNTALDFGNIGQYTDINETLIDLHKKSIISDVFIEEKIKENIRLYKIVKDIDGVIGSYKAIVEFYINKNEKEKLDTCIKEIIEQKTKLISELENYDYNKHGKVNAKALLGSILARYCMNNELGEKMMREAFEIAKKCNYKKDLDEAVIIYFEYLLEEKQTVPIELLNTIVNDIKGKNDMLNKKITKAMHVFSNVSDVRFDDIKSELDNIIEEDEEEVINNAENRLFEIIGDLNLSSTSKRYHKVIDYFYDKLEKFSDEYLEKQNFTREEISEGYVAAMNLVVEIKG